MKRITCCACPGRRRFNGWNTYADQSAQPITRISLSLNDGWIQQFSVEYGKQSSPEPLRCGSGGVPSDVTLQPGEWIMSARVALSAVTGNTTLGDGTAMGSTGKRVSGFAYTTTLGRTGQVGDGEWQSATPCYEGSFAGLLLVAVSGACGVLPAFPGDEVLLEISLQWAVVNVGEPCDGDDGGLLLSQSRFLHNRLVAPMFNVTPKVTSNHLRLPPRPRLSYPRRAQLAMTTAAEPRTCCSHNMHVWH